MANSQTVAASIQAIITPVVTNLVVDNNPVYVNIGIGWPPVKTLQNNVKGTNSVISIYDRKMAKNTTRWNPLVLGTDLTAANITATLSQSTLAHGATATITLAGTPGLGDAVACVITSGSLRSQNVPNGAILTNQAAQIAIASANATPASMATALAAAINADPVMGLLVQASAAGAVVTLTSLLTAGTLAIAANVGNGGINTREIGRRQRNYQVVIWSPTSDIRTVIVAAVETVLQQAELVNWVNFPDGSSGRLFNQNDYDLEDATLADTYRHDFMFSVEYPITELDQLYSVLAPIVQYEV